MNAWRACVRLWAFGSIAWIIFWAWNYTSKCISGADGRMLCPNASGDSILSTDYLHMALTVFGGPLAGLLIGLAVRWGEKTSHGDPDPTR